MNLKGQGALEYLLLIGGAIIVAVIVTTLLLGLSNSSSNQNDTFLRGQLCTQKASLMAPTPGVDNCILAGAVCHRNKYWLCGGTYPKCSSTTSTGAAC